MSITIRVWDLWVRLEKYINSVLGERVRKVLQAREVAKADAFLKKFRSREGYTGKVADHYVPPVKLYPPSKCTHLKGAGGKSRYSPAKDYNLASHTFPDRRTKVWCLYGCGLVAWNGDKNFKNLLKMMEQSSNHHSSSEIIAPDIRKNSITVVVQDKTPNG